MSIEQTRETLTQYVDELLSCGDFARFFTEDVTVSFMGTDRVFKGRETARTLITAFHEQAFRTRIKPTTVLCGDGTAMVEAQFLGTHIGEFEGIPATGRDVDVPYAVGYDFRGNRISALRLYFPIDLLLRQFAGVRAEATV
jgi:predicted ester cyclase